MAADFRPFVTLAKPSDLDAGKRVTLAKKSDALGGFWQNLLSRNESLEDLAQFIAMRGAA